MRRGTAGVGEVSASPTEKEASRHLFAPVKLWERGRWLPLGADLRLRRQRGAAT
jgi:hypothetical protein